MNYEVEFRIGKIVWYWKYELRLIASDVNEKYQVAQSDLQKYNCLLQKDEADEMLTPPEKVI